MKTGIDLIAAERQRQITAEGWTPEHDDTHTKGELAFAAACYVNDAAEEIRSGQPSHKPRQMPPMAWPWAEEWWKPKSVLSRLVRAGALIAAEIDRLICQQPPEPGSPRKYPPGTVPPPGAAIVESDYVDADPMVEAYRYINPEFLDRIRALAASHPPCGAAEQRLLHVTYGSDQGLVNLDTGVLMAAVETGLLFAPSTFPRVMINDGEMEKLLGEEHNWSDCASRRSARPRRCSSASARAHRSSGCPLILPTADTSSSKVAKSSRTGRCSEVARVVERKETTWENH
jgi:hypothetical protein